jgi:hypothetical protein
LSKDPVCASKTVLEPNEFELSIDTEALELTLLKNIEIMRVSEIDTDGRWTIKDSQVKTVQSHYENEYLSIKYTGEHAANLDIKTAGVEHLYASKAPTKMLCSTDAHTAVYVNFIFKKEPLALGQYKIRDNVFLRLPGRVILINMPTPNAKLGLPQATEVNFDPKTLYLYQTELNIANRQTH